jgi:Mandelate racemase / muconate lactonizing enzyme, N-terminal domain
VLAGAVTGRSALNVPDAAEAMARAVRNIGRPGIAATAISAVDIALWDLKAPHLDPDERGEHRGGAGRGGDGGDDEDGGQVVDEVGQQRADRRDA